MATATYKKRIRAYEGADNRAKAIKRIQNEASVRGWIERERALTEAKRKREAAGIPEPAKADIGEQQRALDKRRRDQGAVGAADGVEGMGRKRSANQGVGQGSTRTHQTTRGPRRLSFAEAYSRRTTDTSRQRVLALYGRKKPPKNSNASFQPVKTSTTPEQQAAEMRARAQKKRRPVSMPRRRGSNDGIKTQFRKRVQY